MSIRSNDLAETVKTMFAEETDLSTAGLALDAPLDSLGIDSLDVLKLAARLEEAFEIRITTEELKAVGTLGDIVDRLGEKIAD